MQFAIDLEQMDDLDAASRVPLYAQLADALSLRIRSAHADLAGRALPSELDTAARFNISRPTVRQAMSQLLSEGLIVRGRGRGTFVAEPRASRHLGRAFEFELLPAVQAVEFRLLARDLVTPAKALRQLFNLRPQEKLERITRLRLSKGRVFGYEERYLPLEYAAKVSDRILSREAGVEFARRLIGRDAGHVSFRVRAIPADSKCARLLGMKKGAPVMSSEHTYFTADEEPLVHGTVLFRGDFYEFSFTAPVHGLASEHRIAAAKASSRR